MSQSPSSRSGFAKALITIGSVLAGAIVGGMANMGTIVASAAILPPPFGVDVNDPASINANIGNYSVVQLLCPFFAHAIGTLVGAYLAARIASSVGRELVAAAIVGGLFLLGGIMAVSMIPNAPLWFDVLDLGFAYMPMAILGLKFARKNS